MKDNPLERGRQIRFAGVPEGADALVVADLLREAGSGTVLHVCADDAAMARVAELVRFFAPEIEILTFPAWDCLPYDRVPPRTDIVAERLAALAAVADEATAGPRLVVTTVNAALQRVPPRAMIAATRIALAPGTRIEPEAVAAFLAGNGYHRTETVREPGEYAVRGGIVDVFAPGSGEPVRLDFFGDELEGLRGFDPMSQRTSGPRAGLVLLPASEVVLDEAGIERFRSAYRARFGAVRGNDPLYEAVSEGIRHPGMEHWLPLFAERLETIFDYSEGPVVLAAQADEALAARLEQIADYYAARRDTPSAGDDVVYNPLPPDALYLTVQEWESRLSDRPLGRLDTFDAPAGMPDTVAVGGRRAIDFAEARNRPDVNLFDALARRLANDRSAGQAVSVACYSTGSRDRLIQLMAEHGIEEAYPAAAWAEVLAARPEGLPVFVLGLESGFSVAGRTVYTEQDILGDRLVRRRRPSRRAEDFIAEVSSLGQGDFVVHADHGIGRYDGLETLEIGGAPHDCLRILYAEDAKLFLPVENLELLSRYGSAESEAQLDKLGGASWQARRARVKNRITEMADRLLEIAAERELRQAPKLEPPAGLYEEFCARFPYAETEDQERAIAETVVSLGEGKPMDRLVCGDVGFGKTEVALRAAFVAVMSGKQVAVVVPTTLLARQHHQTFVERFAGLPVEVGQLSRLVTGPAAKAVRDGLADGRVDIVIGTHALLSERITFKELGLVIVDEEQHFGVAQKERLKRLSTDVHVLTLTATPIPRTLQLALAGVRELSLIASPPVDRLAVRTFVLPYDPVTIREAIMREHFRGGQTFYVCPRVEDLPRLEERLKELVPEVKVAVAHGQLAPRALEDVMTAFYERQYEILLSTNIVESGLDVPTANTIIIHRADMFGLAQLYQLRGRVGRAKVRAYAYLTLPPGRTLSESARRRLDVMQTLDTLGAGFSLASHDLDIRGAGNLLGEEQSGHIREVGVELYQQMLEEAVAAAREAGSAAPAEEEWTPTIALGAPVLIPEGYVGDLGLRLGLYRRIAGLVDPQEIEGFAAELIDRFGPLPDEVENLLDAIALKRLCRDAGVEKLEAGPKGAVVSFRANRFADPAGLVNFITSQKGTVSLRPDHKLVYRRDWTDQRQRQKGARRLMRKLAEIAGASAEGAAPSAAQ